MKIVLLGPPGCGKGTQGRRLAKEIGVKFVSTGDILREAIEKGEELGKRIKKYVEGGGLVPDEIMIKLIEKEVSGGVILDGFPRTLRQAQELERVVKIDKVIFFRCPKEIIIKRLINRRVCPKCKKVYNLIYEMPEKKGVCSDCNVKLEKRKDDKKEVIEKRFKEYEKYINDLLQFYDGKLITIDATGEINSVYQELKEVING